MITDVLARHGGKGRATPENAKGGLAMGKFASSAQRLSHYKAGRAHACKVSRWAQEVLRLAISSALWVVLWMWRKQLLRPRLANMATRNASDSANNDRGASSTLMQQIADG